MKEQTPFQIAWAKALDEKARKAVNIKKGEKPDSDSDDDSDDEEE